MDAIDLSAAIVHSSPQDIADWPTTTAITKLTIQPGQNNGLSFVFDANQTWPDYTIPGWDGPIQYTVWAGALLEGVWHVAGLLQMWRTKPSTGAPILAQWGDWCYDANRWGPMVSYRPKAGDDMVFFLSAGDARGGTWPGGVTSVRERSAVVKVALPAGDDGVFIFNEQPPPAPPPEVPPGLPPQVDAIVSALNRIAAALEYGFGGR